MVGLRVGSLPRARHKRKRVCRFILQRIRAVCLRGLTSSRESCACASRSSRGRSARTSSPPSRSRSMVAAPRSPTRRSCERAHSPWRGRVCLRTGRGLTSRRANDWSRRTNSCCDVSREVGGSPRRRRPTSDNRCADTGQRATDAWFRGDRSDNQRTRVRSRRGLPPTDRRAEINKLKKGSAENQERDVEVNRETSDVHERGDEWS